MTQVASRLWVASSIALGCLATISPATAQIVPDNTLPVNSTVTPGCTVCTIDRGTVRGANLFHSFSEFSVPTGGEAFFNNATQIQNILTRVTGNSVSNIDGVLRANGEANLFLLNPNGIIFGARASLNVGGSFLATTANAIGFGNLGFFSATTPNVPSSLLTVNPSALLFNQLTPAAITSQSIASAGLDPVGEATYGLRVPDTRSLLLVGGDINIDGLGIGDRDRVNDVNGGGLKAYGGRIELGGLAGAGTVGLFVDGNNLSLSFPIAVVRANVSLTNGADVNVRTGGEGSIAVNAQNFSMAGESVLKVGIDSGLGSSGSIAGNIEINTTGVINLSDRSLLGNLVDNGARGQGGDTNITTSQLLVSGGSQIGTGTFGAGNAGNLTVNATDKVQVIGRSTDGQASSGLFTASEGTGNAGNLTITTGQLLVSNGAQVSAGTLGAGNGGNLTVNATDKVQLIGTSADGRIRSGLFTSSLGTRNAGNLMITTGLLLVSNGAFVSATTFGTGNGGNLTVNATDKVQVIGTSADGQAVSGLFTPSLGTGNAGNLTITTGHLLVSNGAQIDAGTFGTGNGGNLTINATDKVQVIGRSADGQFLSGLFTSSEGTGVAGNLTITTGQLLVSNGAQVNAGTLGTGNGGDLTVHATDKVQLIGTSADDPFPTGLFTQSEGTGDAGNLTITTPTLQVQDGAVSVRSLAGQAGNLTIQANSLVLNQGTLFAETAKNGEEGANINLLGLDLLRLDNESLISANANNQATGGNITIDSTFVVATPPTGANGSDMTANAVQGNGGRVNITTQGLFGIQFRPQLTPQNDITVSSQFGLTGEFQLNSPDVDPSSGLINLPTAPVDTEVSQVCQAGAGQNQNSFIITGRGGLPPNPRQVLRSRAVEVDWVSLDGSANNPTEDVQNRGTQRRVSGERDSQTANNVKNRPHEIVEAQGWVIDENGKIALVATAPTATPHSSWQKPVECHIEESTK
jgi:filamentous hemagglutinin family protein